MVYRLVNGTFIVVEFPQRLQDNTVVFDNTCITYLPYNSRPDAMNIIKYKVIVCNLK